jgi:hypothetical protein
VLKTPVPEPLVYTVPDVILGRVLVVLITTPRAVTGDPPSEVILPPEIALLDVTEEVDEVVTGGQVKAVVTN